MDVIPAFECFLCEELRPEGVRIGRVWCCAACEDRIVRSQAGTADYEELVRAMRRFWQVYGQQCVP
ncbi:MAG: hypothetical protein GX161_03720 [Firmicutes bacterium]|jgi:hypothetical protein|nr:hypothetical protein [Bacillota bacterium]